MAGPWEDFKAQPAPEGPWSDFQSAAPAQASGMPWEEFKSPGPMDFVTETAKSVARGTVGSLITSPLQGLAGQIYEPDTSKPIPQPPPGGYQSEADVPELPILPVAQSTPYKLAQTVESAMPQDRGILNPVVRDVASGVGSVIGNIGMSLIPGVRAIALPTVVAQGAGEATERAVKATATEDQIRRAASLGNIAGATEFADFLLPNLGTWGKVSGLVAKVGVTALKGAFIEGGQEGLQQFIQNAIAKGIYKPEQALSEDVAYNAVIGAIVGGGVGAVMTRRTPEEAPPGTVPPTDPGASPGVDPNMPSGAPPVTSPDPNLVTPQEPVAPTAPVPAPVAAPDIPTVEPSRPSPVPVATPNEPVVVSDLGFTRPEPGQMNLLDLIQPTGPQTQPLVAKEDVEIRPDIERGRTVDMLSQHQYGNFTTAAQVTLKELYQNAFDAIKGVLERGQRGGNIDVKMDPKSRTITVRDDGEGMPASVMGKEFVTIAGSKKSTSRPSGGHGVAKVQILYGSENIVVRSVHNGQYSEMTTTGPELRKALEAQGSAGKITTRRATEKELAEFPTGSGTVVQITVPKSYVDPNTGETRAIPFDSYIASHNSLTKSPLFDNINVSFNGKTVPAGTNFPIENFTPFTNLKTEWGNARVYVGKQVNPDFTGEWQMFHSNVHVLSNGLWQFDVQLKGEGDNLIPFDIYVDVSPQVGTTQAGYPFTTNRQDFSPAVKKTFQNLFAHLQMRYARAGLENMASNFGTMQYLDFDPTTKAVRADTKQKIEPKQKPTTTDALSLINLGDAVVERDGKLYINGKETSDITPDIMKRYEVTTADLKIDESEVDPNRVMLHDNLDITVSPVETRSITDYGREKFGRRFDEFVFALGSSFMELRNAVVRLGNNMGTNDGKQYTYKDMAKAVIGISFDQRYRGVTIKLPFVGMFLNPVVPQSTNPIEAGVDLSITMIHEIAHHYEMNHGLPWRAEFQRLLRVLTVAPDFDLRAFQQKLVNTIATYEDMFQHLNGVFTSGDFNIQPRGKPFTDSADEAVNAPGTIDAARFGGQSPRGSELSDWVAAGETIPGPEPGRAEPSHTVGPSGTHRPSDNGRGANYNTTRGIDSGITAPPQQPEVNVIRESVKGALNGEMPPEIKEAAVHADRYNWFYKWMAGITQLLDNNPYFEPLRKYVERGREMHSDESMVWDASLNLLKNHWRKLDRPQRKALTGFLLEMQDMTYLSDAERGLDVTRHPTQAEFDALRKKYGLSDAGVDVYNRLRRMDESFTQLLERESKLEAQRVIKDPVRLAARIDEIEARGRQSRAQPFFPFTRFGRYYAVVKDAAGTIVHVENFEPARFVGITVKRAEKYQMARVRELERKAPPGHTVEHGVLPETAEPLIGMPSLLLQGMQSMGMQFTEAQVKAMQIIQGARNPSMSLKHRAMYQDRSITGYSLDLERSFTKYYFHGGRYLSRLKHVWALKAHIAEAQLVPGNKAGLIASHMAEHLDNTILDAKGDFGVWKGAVFLWAMGYSVSAATMNLTQTPMISYPFLAAKFGDIRATRHIVKSMVDVTNFYRRGKYTEPAPNTTLNFEMQALGYGIKTGRVSETQAAEIAGFAGGGKLMSGMAADSVIERGVAKFQERAALAFELAEQFNRRVVYRAALRLAQENPTSKFVKESVQKYRGEYEQLQKGSPTQPPFTEAQAAAIVTAVHSTDQTQFVYSKYARSRLFRGKKNIFFVFKQYLQSLLWMLGSNKSDVLPRYLIMAMLMGGLGGVPGYDDLKSIFRAIGIWFFGKDANLDKMIRDWSLQFFDGKVAPDLILHGLARRGFGLPALADMLGSLVTGTPGRSLIAPGFEHSKNVPAPVLDRSRAIGLGNLLPVDVGKLATPTDKLDKTIAEEAQRASGAFFSVGFNMYKALMDRDNPAGDFKRWEKAMPRALGAASGAYRAFNEGRERSGKGGPNSAATIVNYDVRDTEQLLEVIAQGLGYQTLRKQAKWDLILAQAESSAFYDMRKKDLQEEFFEALKGRNPKEIADVRAEITRYNQSLPDFARANVITPEGLKKSVLGREKSVISREIGVPIQTSKIGISREMQRLFPEATVDVRRVR